MSNTMSVYVGTYKKYNEGSLFGSWLELDKFSDKDDFIEACLELHKDEEDPELMFQDWEGIPDDFISECSIDETIWELLGMDDDRLEAAKAYIDWMGSWDADDFEDKYCGHYDSFREYVEQYFDDCIAHEIPECYHGYFDMDALERDLGFDFYEYDGHIFRNY